MKTLKRLLHLTMITMKLIQRTRPKWMAEKALATETQRDYEPINSKTISSVCIIGSLVCYVVQLKEYTHTLRHSYFMRMDSLHQQAQRHRRHWLTTKIINRSMWEQKYMRRIQKWENYPKQSQLHETNTHTTFQVYSKLRSQKTSNEITCTLMSDRNAHSKQHKIK